ncbi:MAG: TAXI family TRAP transporter solute-binding subunit, partial [Pseudomonadota bacterium]
MRHLILAFSLFVLAFPPVSSLRAQVTEISLATATPGGGFELFGGHAATVINAADPTLNVTPFNTRGSGENLTLLPEGAFDIGLVSGVPAYEAFEGIGREKVDLKIISATYPGPGYFAVMPESPARSIPDL